jgi:hypothetical protein
LPQLGDERSVFFIGVCEMTNNCPVCGYGMDRPPADFNICPSCETEFGYSDSGTHYDELRMAWLEDGAPWRSAVVSKPDGWNGYVQLALVGLISLDDFALLTGVPIRVRVISGGAEQTSTAIDDWANAVPAI